MRILKSMIEKDPKFRMGYQCAIDDLKDIFENAKIFNPKMDIIDLVEDWEKITALVQKKICGEKDN
jgi:hypothetical protein